MLKTFLERSGKYNIILLYNKRKIKFISLFRQNRESAVVRSFPDDFIIPFKYWGQFYLYFLKIYA